MKKYLILIILLIFIFVIIVLSFSYFRNSEKKLSYENLNNVELVKDCKTDFLYSIDPGFSSVNCTEKWLDKSNYVLLLLQRGEKENLNKYKARIISNVYNEVHQEEIQIQGNLEENSVQIEAVTGNYLVISNGNIIKIGKPFVRQSNGINDFGINWQD